MSEVFQQDLSDEERPGGPFLIQLLFREAVPFPGQEEMSAVLARHCGAVECFCCDEKMAGFAALDHIVEFKDGAAPVQLLILSCTDFNGPSIDSFVRSQMWDCREDRDRILEECRYQVAAVDMLAAGLPSQDRANLDMDFMEALAELYPSCEAFYSQNCGKLFRAQDVRNHSFTGLSRFIQFGVNARFFNIEGTEDMLVDTVGMQTLFLPDLQYHFRDMDPNWVVNHAYNLADYLLQNDCPIDSGDTVDGIINGRITPDIQWKCQYEASLVQPPRGVLDVRMGSYAAGTYEEDSRQCP